MSRNTQKHCQLMQTMFSNLITGFDIHAPSHVLSRPMEI